MAVTPSLDPARLTASVVATDADASEVPTARVMTGAVLATVAAILPTFLAGAVAVQAGEDLGFGASGLGLLVAGPFLVAAVTSAMLGRTAERLGAGRTLRISSLAAAVVSLALASVPSFGLLALGLGCAGAVNALTQPAANLLVARGVPATRQGWAFGLKQSAMPGATMLAGLAVPTLALPFSWRWAYVAAAAIAVAAAVAVPVAPANGSLRASLRSTASPRPDIPLRPMVVLAIAVGLGAAAAGALAAFIVSAAVDAGIAESAAGYLLTVGSGLGIAIRLFTGGRADRRDGGHLRVVALMLLGGAAAFVAYALGGRAALILATPAAFGFGWAWPGLFNFSIVRNNPSAPAAATGITQTGTYVGAMSGPLVFGWIAEHGSYAAAWSVGASWFVLAALGMVVGRRLLRAVKAERGIPVTLPLG
jgi:MFS family permease